LQRAATDKQQAGLCIQSYQEAGGKGKNKAQRVPIPDKAKRNHQLFQREREPKNNTANGQA